MNYLLLLIPLSLFVLFIWSMWSIRNTAINDWATLEELKKKANEVETKEEIEELYKELSEKGSKIHNQYIYPELFKIDGYLRGKYEQFKEKL